jgi:hypothetical protein
VGRCSKGRHEVRNNGPWGAFYRLKEVVEGTGDVRSPARGVEINLVSRKEWRGVDGVAG